MGLFGNLFKGKKENEQVNIYNAKKSVEENKIEMSYDISKDGTIEFRRYKPNTDIQHVYDDDTTVMIINPQAYPVEGKQLFNCKVGWTRGSNTIIFNEYGFQALDYQDVLVQVSIAKLQSGIDHAEDEEYADDTRYAEAFMGQVLNKEHVMKYVNMGLEEAPEVPCGNYIGGLNRKEDGSYRKNINPRVAMAVHNSKMMVNRRQAHREQQIKQEEINARNAQRRKEIARLQAEIEEEYK